MAQRRTPDDDRDRIRSTDWNLLAAVALTSLLAGGLHFAAAWTHRELTTLSGLFVVAALAQVAWGVALLLRPPRGVVVAGGVMNALFVAFYVVTRLTGVGIEGLDEAQPIGLQDVMATLLEAAAAVGALAIVRPSLFFGRRPAQLGPQGLALVGCVALVLAGPAFAADGGHDHHTDGHDHLDTAGAHEHAAGDEHGADGHGHADGDEHGHDGDDHGDGEHGHDGDDHGDGEHGHDGDDHGDGEHGHGDGAHADGDHSHADGDDHAHAAGDDHAHDDGDPGHAHDPGDPTHPHDPGNPHPHDPGNPHPHDPGDPNPHPHPPGPGPNPHPHPPGPGPDPHPHPEPDPGAYPEDWTEQQRQFADQLIATTEVAMTNYNTQAKAQAAGFTWIGDGAQPGGYQHWINLGRFNDSHILDPSYPESLVFRNTGAGLVLEAAMFILPWGYTVETVPSNISWLPGWHKHDDLCFTAGGRITAQVKPGESCPSGSFLIVTPPMLHVWIVDTECGRFAGVDGGGLMCDHEHDH